VLTDDPPPSGPGTFGNPNQQGAGSSSDRWQKAQVTRDGVPYAFMANGWGPGFQSQSVNWRGTSFTVVDMQGKQGPKYEPASYPTVFCGQYSDFASGACGLPRAISSISSLKTGWKWQASATGQYNAAYDIWLGNGPSVSNHSGFLMVWLRDPAGQRPAGAAQRGGVKVAGVPGLWDIWVSKLGKPCISYVRREGSDYPQIEFDAMAFIKDVPTRGLTLPGNHVLSVAVGFEIWNGPVKNLATQDFYVRVQ
jgi:hypothetical protein